MLRYDPMHPDQAKFLAPTTTQQEIPKKVKKKKNTNIQDDPDVEEQVVEKVEVSKEQFYKVSDTLKEAMIQPNSFSLRNLFAKEENDDEGSSEQSPIILSDINYIQYSRIVVVVKKMYLIIICIA